MAHSSIDMAESSPAPGVHRLTEMLVEEVSLVDRAANKRKFLVVKRATEEPKKGTTKMATGVEVTPTNTGGFTAATPEATTKASLDVPPGFKAVASPILTKIGERLAALAETVDGATEAEVGDDGSIPGVPGEFIQELGAVMGLLEKLGSMWPAADMEMPEGEGEMPADGEPADGEPAEMRMRAAVADMTKALTVQKVGAKMSKERFARLEQALSVLNSLLGELGQGMGDVSMRAKAKDDDEATKRLGKLEEGMSEMVKAIGRLAGVMQKTDTELASVRKARTHGNSLPVDGTPTTKDPNEVSWPLDMNKAFTREGVNKSESFYDE